jgi:hypothetical protein
MPGDRLTSPEAAKESTARDGSERSWNWLDIAIRFGLASSIALTMAASHWDNIPLSMCVRLRGS